MTLTWIDILFLVTVAFLVLNGLRNGAIFSIVHLISIPLGVVVAINFGPQFTSLLASNGLPSTPLISYAALFFGTVLVLHMVGTSIRGGAKRVPLVGAGDSLLGGLIGFVEAWLIWLILLIILGNFLHGAQDAITQGSHVIPGLNVQVTQLRTWHDFYNQTVNNSMFAKVNSLFVKELPNIPQPTQ